MSVQPRINIPIVFQFIKDDTADVKILKRHIHLAIICGIEKCIKAAIEMARLIVPESLVYEGNPRGYPPSYESEQLMNSYIDHMRRELTRLKKGSTTLREEYHIEPYDWVKETSYAKFVNEMTNVKWTKPTSQPNFIETLTQFLQLYLDQYIAVELQQVDQSLELLFSVY